MVEWAQVRWTEARQVVALQSRDPAMMPAGDVSPVDHYTSLRTAGRRDEAVAFLALALQRMDAVAWACRVVEEAANGARIDGLDRQALDHALRWLGDPDDDRRRAARDAADAAGDSAPERLLGFAVFFSGGTISQPDLPPVLPAPEVSGKLAAAAICLAAHRGAAAKDVLDRALDLGEKVAEQGIGALSTP